MRDHRRIGYVGLGLSIIGIGLSVYPIHAPRTVFITIAAGGGLLVVVGALYVARERLGAGRTRRRVATEHATIRQRQHTAASCRAFADALSDFIEVRERRAPRERMFMRGRATRRLREWESEGVEQYRDDLRPWAQAILEDAAALGIVPSAAPWGVDARNMAQIKSLPRVFHSAALALERDTTPVHGSPVQTPVSGRVD